MHSFMWTFFFTSTQVLAPSDLQFQVLILFMFYVAMHLFCFHQLGKLNEIVTIHNMNLSIFVAQYF
jgi:hypothetical protein